MKLACPHCNTGELRVIETRPTEKMVFRTRSCVACAAKVITCEIIFTGGCIPKAVRRNESVPDCPAATDLLRTSPQPA